MLSEQTGVTRSWVALLLVPILFVLRRQNLDATIAAALLIGIAILLVAAASSRSASRTLSRSC